MTPAAKPAQARNNGLAQIHIAKQQLGMDDDTYRAVLWAVARVKSAKDLDHAGRAAVLDHFRKCGWKPKPPKKPFPGRPRNIDSELRGPQLKKIEALLADAKRPWSYVDGMARRMFGVEGVTFCHEDQLQRLIAALTYDQQRRRAKEAT